jgi:Trk K+ transport system NAD-binding subunit
VTVAAVDLETTQELPDGRRFVICGDNTLAYRLADELSNRHNGDVTVIVRSRTSTYGALIAKLPDVRVVEADRPHPYAFTEVDLSTVDALALVDSNDVANIDAALAAHEMNPHLRMVVRMFNSSLGEGMAELPYCTVLSDGALAAPAFVGAALGDPTTRLTLRGDTMYVAARSEVNLPGDIVCGLAITHGRPKPEVLPADQDAADLVLVRAAKHQQAPPRRVPRLTNRYPVRAVLGRTWRRVRAVLALFGGLLVATAAVLTAVSPRLDWWQAFYTSILVALGGTDVNPDDSTLEQLILVLLVVASFLVIPFLIGGVLDAVVKARLDLAEGTVTRRASGHVVVVGLGGVGTNVLQMLYDQGVDVVAVDKSADARGVDLARELRIPLIIGDATRRETLLAASVPTCRALVVVTSDDVTNLATALVARAATRESPRQVQLVLRLFDGEFAARIQQAFQLHTSYSVSYLAVPSFAARMLGQALDTIAVGRRVLVVAELQLDPHSELASGEHTVGDLRRPGEAWLLELVSNQGKRLPSTMASGRRLYDGEKLLMVATRGGLARLIAEAAPPPESEPRRPIVIFEAGVGRPLSTD